MPTFHHVGLTVRDIGQSIAFYTDAVGMLPWDQEEVLGLSQNPEHEQREPLFGVDIVTTKSEAFGILTKNPNAGIRYAMLRSADGALVLQLVEYVVGGGAPLQPDHDRAGSVHLSFFVDDIDYAKAVAAGLPGAQVTSEIVQINPDMRSFYVTDPDGIPVELLEVTVCGRT